MIEDTFDWYAQDSDGNVWYLGEDTVECKKGKIKNHDGSFEAGVDGAQPGVIMPADPHPGLKYRQEYYAGEAEDRGRGAERQRAGGVPVRALHQRPADEGPRPAGAEGLRVQDLRPPASVSWSR